MSTKPSKSTTLDAYKLLGFIRDANGTSFTRLPVDLTSFPPPKHDPNSIPTKDITINESNNTWARLFLPQQTLDSSNNTKLPLIIYFHGGGFIFFSAATTFCHDHCVDIAIELNAIVVSIEYRIAPEHRLPAAYEDAMEALQWIITSTDQWLREFADFSRCFLMGGSAGANIAYHAARRAAEKVGDLEPMKIQGVILHQPFFGGSKRTESELRLIDDRNLPLCHSDAMWELSLPVGADRDHEYCNPMGDAVHIAKMRELGWRIFVDWGDMDPLMDRQTEFIKMLQEKGLALVSYCIEGGGHGAELSHPSKCKALNAAYRSFISSTSTSV